MSKAHNNNNVAVGALAGQIVMTTIDHCGVRDFSILIGSAANNSLAAVGGLVGDVLYGKDDTKTSVINDCYAYGNITSATDLLGDLDLRHLAG